MKKLFLLFTFIVAGCGSLNDMDNATSTMSGTTAHMSNTTSHMDTTTSHMDSQITQMETTMTHMDATMSTLSNVLSHIPTDPAQPSNTGAAPATRRPFPYDLIAKDTEPDGNPVYYPFVDEVSVNDKEVLFKTNYTPLEIGRVSGFICSMGKSVITYFKGEAVTQTEALTAKGITQLINDGLQLKKTNPSSKEPVTSSDRYKNARVMIDSVGCAIEVHE